MFGILENPDSALYTMSRSKDSLKREPVINPIANIALSVEAVCIIDIPCMVVYFIFVAVMSEYNES
jgi:hypothetical protein